MILVLLIPVIGSCAHASQLDVYGISVLEYASGDMSKPVAAVGVIDSLYEIERRSLKKEEIYVDLLDYYLGSGGGAVLNELITQNGDKILPLLKKNLIIQFHVCQNFN